MTIFLKKQSSLSEASAYTEVICGAVPPSSSGSGCNIPILVQRWAKGMLPDAGHCWKCTTPEAVFLNLPKTGLLALESYAMGNSAPILSYRGLIASRTSPAHEMLPALLRSTTRQSACHFHVVKISLEVPSQSLQVPFQSHVICGINGLWTGCFAKSRYPIEIPCADLDLDRIRSPYDVVQDEQ